MDPFVSTAETHSGALIFFGDRVVKLKKPVDLGFLDFRERESRLWACRRELELNRRLAPDVYLEVVDIGPADGTPCDHAVVMRRMPEDRSLAALVEAGAPIDDEVRRIAKTLADFHSRADRAGEHGTLEAVRKRWDDNLDGLRSSCGELLDTDLIDEIADAAREFLAGRASLFDRRIDEGRVVDGHGDLLSDDIFCLDDGPRILDCIEFDDTLRLLDALDDVACLAMDLEYRGTPELGQRLLDWYTEFSDDPAPRSLAHFYVAYRALVRAKVACVKHAQGDENKAADARDHLRIAAEHIRETTPRLVLIGGPPGTGKTTLAEHVADRLGTSLLSSDRIRKELAGLSPTEPGPSEIYRPEHTERTYHELADRAETLLAQGESVVLDASWTREEHRRLAAEATRRTHSGITELRCGAPESTASARIRERRNSISDADEDIARSIAHATEEWPEATEIDTTRAPEDATEDAVAAIRAPS